MQAKRCADSRTWDDSSPTAAPKAPPNSCLLKSRMDAPCRALSHGVWIVLSCFAAHTRTIQARHVELFLVSGHGLCQTRALSMPFQARKVANELQYAGDLPTAQDR